MKRELEGEEAQTAKRTRAEDDTAMDEGPPHTQLGQQLHTERAQLLAELDVLRKELAHYEAGGTALALFQQQQAAVAAAATAPGENGTVGYPAASVLSGAGKGTMGFVLAEDEQDDEPVAAEAEAGPGEAAAGEEAAPAEAEAKVPEPEPEPEPAPAPVIPKDPAAVVPIPLLPLKKMETPSARAPLTQANLVVGTPANQIPALTSDEINTLKIRKDQVMKRLGEVRKLRPLPKQPEPHRPEVHHDCVMKEMIWLAKDFSQERRWKMAVASKTSRAAIRAKVSGQRKVEQVRKANEHRLRQIARGIAKDIKQFWQKIETVASFKHEEKLQEKHQALRQKHLEFLVGQTEKYSGLLAEKLGDEKDEALAITPAPAEGAAAEGVAAAGASAEGASAAASAAEASVSEGAPAETEAPSAPICWQDELLGGAEEKLEIALERAETAGMHGVPLEPEDAEYVPEVMEDDESTLDESETSPDNSDPSEMKDLEDGATVPIEQLIEEHNKMNTELGEEELYETSSSEGEDEEEATPELAAAGLVAAPAEAPASMLSAPTETPQTVPSETATVSVPAAAVPVAAVAQAAPSAPAPEAVQPAPAVAEVPAAAAAAAAAEEPMAMEVDAVPKPESATGEVQPVQVDSAAAASPEAAAPAEAVAKLEPAAQPTPAATAPEPVAPAPVAAPVPISAPMDKEEEELESAAQQARTAQPTGHTLQTTRVGTPVPFLLKATLREYQHVGVDWLATMFERRLNGILADEMGLGKTIQTISLLAHLACEKGNWGPHLIVVPTSVMLNWEIEFKKFCPAFKVLTYYGTQKERKLKRQGWSKPNAFHVCITSYKLVMQDHAAFKRKKWVYLILDEAQNIKNFKSQRWQMLLNFNSKRRLLLTGTPLQNNLMELWSLMHFLMPHVFSSHKEFSEWFANPLTAMVEGRDHHNNFDVVKRLHGVLRPFILRRLKKDVELQMPPKFEHVINCPLSKRQRNLYDEFLRRSEVRETLGSGRLLGILNVLMQLRKCCNHPDMFEERPIMSPFDSEQLCINVPWRVLTAGQPDLWSSVDLGLLNLGCMALGDTQMSGASSSKRIIELQETSENIMQQSLESLETDGLDTSVFAKYNQALRARQKESRLDAAKRIALVNSRRVQASPVYGTDLHRLLTLDPVQGTACAIAARTQGRYARDCPAALVDGVCSLRTRVMQLEPYVSMNLLCIIPKARALPVKIVSRAQEAVRLQDAQTALNFTALKPALDQTLALTRPMDIRLQMFFPDKRLLQYDCGKLQQLDILLRRLKSGGHRALIFTQMTKMLDILEAFLNFYGYVYVRLDGSTRVEERQQLMERFNHNDKIFVFILSTRSGGFGINLVGADSVIFYDSDWNPAMDAQAQDRAHRIGQTRPVHIYRLISEHTVEENILKKCNQKRQLDNLVMQDGSFTPEFFKKLNLRELFEGVEDVKEEPVAEVSADELNMAMADAEEETDREATKAAHTEIADGETEFELKGDGEEEEGAAGEEAEKAPEAPIVGAEPELTEKEQAGEGVAVSMFGKPHVEDDNMLKEVKELTKADGIAEAIEQRLSNVQKYALRFIESVYADVAALQLNQLDERMNAGQQEWGMGEFERIRQEEEEAMDEDDEVLFYEIANGQTSAECYYQHAERLRLQGVPDSQLDVFGPPDPESVDVYAHPADTAEEEIAGLLKILPPQQEVPLRRKGKNKRRATKDNMGDDHHRSGGRRSEQREMEEAEPRKYGRGDTRTKRRRAMEECANKKRRRGQSSVFDEDMSDDELDAGVVRGFRSGLVSGSHLSPGADMGGLFSYTKTKGVKKPARRVMPKTKPGDTKGNKKKDCGWSLEEDMALEHAVREYGDNWKLVADLVAMHQRVLPRRRFSDNECKDYYFERDYIKEDGGKPPSAQSRTSFATAVLRSVQRCSTKLPAIIDAKQAAHPQLRVMAKEEPAPAPAPAEGEAPAAPPPPNAKFVEALLEQTASHDPLALIKLFEAQRPKQTPEQQSLTHRLKHPMGARSHSLMRSSTPSASAPIPHSPSVKAKPEAAPADGTQSTPTKGTPRGKTAASPTSRAKPKAAGGKRTPRAKADKASPTKAQTAAAQRASAAQAAAAAQQPVQPAGAMAAPAPVQRTPQQAAAAAAAQQQAVAAQQAAAQQAAAQQAAQQQAVAQQQQAAAVAAAQQQAAAAAAAAQQAAQPPAK